MLENYQQAYEIVLIETELQLINCINSGLVFHQPFCRWERIFAIVVFARSGMKDISEIKNPPLRRVISGYKRQLLLCERGRQIARIIVHGWFL
ncbi:hypothetical protein ACH6EH_10335 [Paenibacillus sp. JSM ZJ436]